MTTQIEQLPFAMQLFRESDDVYPGVGKVLQDGDESAKSLVLLDLDNLLFLSNVSKLRAYRYALDTLRHLLDNFPEGVQAAIDVGAVPILEPRRNPDNLFDRVGDVLGIIESHKDTR
ncbi:ARM domain-containing protein [Rhizoctonia solani]|uniref:ARM domain-containing protein n=1 Tax=Rhizoctonia solani TaxID=456999 RepID=A0A8H8NT49_9AGAM|nr:ARM domain-containing protein [Rhizoctonia solani]QRW18845.1 ARM domain-containing protein [Rhizoctonia solani]